MLLLIENHKFCIFHEQTLENLELYGNTLIFRRKTHNINKLLHQIFLQLPSSKRRYYGFSKYLVDFTILYLKTDQFIVQLSFELLKSAQK